MSTVIDEFVETVDLSDLAPSCDFTQHGRFGDGPAVWIITLRQPRVCGCRMKSIALVCDPCWTVLGNHDKIRCPKCSQVDPMSANVLRVDRL